MAHRREERDERAGISNRPPERESCEQEQVPARGTAKESEQARRGAGGVPPRDRDKTK